jgi:ankyrin repeat protein
MLFIAYGAQSDEVLPSIVQAAKNNDLAQTRALINQEIDVNMPQADGATALHWAVHRDNLDAVRMLVKAGADVNAMNDFGIVPMWLACENKNSDIAKLLLKAGADPNRRNLTGESVLMTAAHYGNAEIVRQLLKAGAEINATEPVRNQNALMWAIGEDHTDAALVLLEAGADIHSKTAFSFTPLMFAARKGNLPVAKALLDAGADPSAATTYMGTNLYQWPGVNDKNRNDPGYSVLQIAVHRGKADVVDLLLENGADPNYDAVGYSALQWASGSWETSLDGVTGIRPTKEHEWYHMGGLREDKHRIIRSLLKHGADPNSRLKKDPTRFGFSPNPRPRGATPYILAAIAADAKAMDILVEHGADPTLVPDNKVPAILLASGVNRSLTNSLATEEQSLEAVKMAMTHGANVTDTDKGGNTTLHGAAKMRLNGLIQFLFDEGADIYAKNKRGWNPEYMAAHELRGAGEVAVTSSPTLDLVRELSKPATLKNAIEDWSDVSPHVREAVESLLTGELDRIAKEAAEKAKKKPKTIQ